MQDNKNIPTGIAITLNSDDKAIRIIVHFPQGTTFVAGELKDVYAQFPLVDYFLRMINFKPDTNTMEIVIPYVLKLNPVAGRASGSDDDDYISDIDSKPRYACWGDYLIPHK